MKSLNTIEKNNVRVLGNIESSSVLLFAHGFGTNQQIWNNTIQPFLSTHKVVVYDNVGAVNSNIDSYSKVLYRNLEAYAEDLLQICDSLNLKNVIFVGHSVSATIGIIACVRKPELFSKLILIGASPRYLNDGEYYGGLEVKDIHEVFKTMTSNYFAWVSGFAPLMVGEQNNQTMVTKFSQGLKDLRPDIAVSVLEVIFNADYRNLLSKLHLPVLLIQTEHDSVVPDEVATYLKLHIQNSQLLRLPIQGHLPHFTHPQFISQAIQEFLG